MVMEQDARDDKSQEEYEFTDESYVADMPEDEYGPETAPPEENIFEPGADTEEVPEFVAPIEQKPSMVKKLFTIVGLIVAIIGVYYFLMYQQQAKMEAESDVVAQPTKATASISSTAMPSAAPTTLPTTPSLAKTEALQSPTMTVSEPAQPAIAEKTSTWAEQKAAFNVARPPSSLGGLMEATTPVGKVNEPQPTTTETSGNDVTQLALLNRQHIAELSTDMRDLKSSVAGVNTKLDKMASQISDISKPVAKKSTKTVKKRVVRRPAKKVVTFGPSNAFHVKAIIPGRAWLESSGGYGESYSVAVGDQVYGFGKVIRIAVEDGKVTMSSGKIFSYGPNDH